MILKKIVRFVFLFSLIVAVLPVEHVQAAKGIPGSGQFGYGVRVSINDANLKPALECASKINPDWIVVDLFWNEFTPKSNTSPDWTNLDLVMRFAGDQRIPVMISLSRPPAWALSDRGPDADLTFKWIVTLINRYPETLQAVEIFAGANTRQGWGAKPAPKAYARLFSSLQEQTAVQGLSITLVAGGLIPVVEDDSENEISDITFLQKLYDNDLKEFMPVISLQMPNTTGGPLTPPGGQESRYLRHYEEIRQVMLNNNHSTGLIWITRLAPPNGSINSSDKSYLSNENRTQWLAQTLNQLQSQLYLGIAVFDYVDPASKPMGGCNIQNSASILANQNDQTKGQKSTHHPLKQGRPKSQLIGKGEPPA